MDDFKLYTPSQPRRKNHVVLKFLMRFIIDAVILGLIGWGLMAGSKAIGFTYDGGITITSPWGGKFNIGNPVANNNDDKNDKPSETTDKNNSDKKQDDSNDKTDDNDANNTKKSNDSNTDAEPADTNGLTDVEKQLTDFKPQLGTDGTYRDAAEQVAKIAGAEIKWNLSNIPCTGTTSETTVALYCPTTPNVIYVNESHKDYETLARSDTFIDSIKHELAHRAIDQLCRTTDPSIANGRTEAIANSYAVLYFGANRSSYDNTNTIGLKTPLAYVPDAESDEMARQVHQNNCGVSNNANTPTTNQ